MIKTVIKHWIYDFCIDQVFNGIQKNFTQPKDDAIWKQLKEGYHYQWIKGTVFHCTFYDVYVIKINLNKIDISYRDSPDGNRHPYSILKEDISEFF